MASVEQIVRNDLLLWPSIHVNRFSVLHHLFCVIGNGYEWKDGELVESGSKESKEVSIEDAIKKIIDDELSIGDFTFYMFLEILSNSNEKDLPSIKDKLQNEVNDERERIINEINEMVSLTFLIDERQADMSYPSYERYPYHTVELYKNSKTKFYPICEYSRLCNLPDDIKTDWLIAARDMYNFIIHNPQYIDENYKKDFDEFLPKIKARLEELEAKL